MTDPGAYDGNDLTQLWDFFQEPGSALPPNMELNGPVGDPSVNCPVLPVGEREGVFYMLDRRGQFRALTARQMGQRSEQQAMTLGDETWQRRHFPKLASRKFGNETKLIIVGYSAPAVAAWLMAECAKQPMYGPQVVQRQPGVWPGENGELVAHCGDEILISEQWRRAGFRTGDTIWVAAPPVQRPGVACDASVARIIQNGLQECWRFRHPGGTIMFLGVIGGGYLGAVPRWRPNLFLIGDPGTGKSKLLDVGRAMTPFHNYTTDTTRAGLEQSVTGRAMVSFIDEVADQADMRGAQNLLNLTLSSTGEDGAKIARGTADGVGRSASVLGSFVLASTAPPEMRPQHLARVALVELLAPETGADHLEEIEGLIVYCRRHGEKLWGRALAGFNRYQSALVTFREALGRSGCAPRQMDQMGAILAGWWALVEDGAPSEREAINAVAAVTDFVSRADEIAEQTDGRQVAQHLASVRLEGDRSSEKWPAAEICTRVWETKSDPDTGEAIESFDPIWHERAGRNGLRVIRADDTASRFGRPPAPRGGPGDGVWIAFGAVPIKAVFEGTAWGGQRYRYLLRGLPSAKESAGPMRIGHVTARAIWLSRADFLGEDAAQQ